MFSLFDALEAIWDGLVATMEVILEKKKKRYKMLWIVAIIIVTFISLFFIKKIYELQGV